MTDRLLRLEEKMDSLTEVVIRLDEQSKVTHALLIKHDASGAKALSKAEAVEDRLDANEAMWKVPLKYLALFGKVAAAIAAIFGAYKLFVG